MNTYEVELRSSVDEQSRVLSLEAPDEAAARAHAEKQELALVEASLLPPAKDLWEIGGTEVPEGDANVNCARWDAYHPEFAKYAAGLPYQEAVSAATRRLSDIANRVDIDAKGKFRYANLNGRAKARFAAHRQAEPYAIVDVRTVNVAEQEAQRLVRDAVAMVKSDPRKWALTLRYLRERGVPLNAVTGTMFGLPWQKQVDGSSVTVHSSATIQCSLHTAYTANQDTHAFDSDITASEITGTGYTVKGVTLGSKTTNYNTSTDQIWLDAADPSWATSTLSATDANFWVDTAGASTTDPLWGNLDFGATVTTTAGTFLITLDATGYINIDIT
jgi:hypothetical protein